MITKVQIENIVKRYNIKLDRFILREDLVDVHGSVKITNTSLRKLPIRFGRVSGDFYCYANKLQTLKGSPDFVGGDFNCANNQLTSLKGSPSSVGRDFACHENSLTSLKGCPTHIHGNFNAFLNKLVTLDGAPEIIGGNCSLFENDLISLESSLRHVGSSLHVTGNPLTNLIGLPEYIGNILSINNRTSIYMGKKNCQVKRIEIEIQKKPHKKDFYLPPIIVQNQKYLPTVFKYMYYLKDDIFSDDDKLNQSNFENIIYDIKSGLR
ncbi:hypothetical protein B0A79_23860 [Flavobacterium piscis]|uniref:Leucine-rich repeat domain-containing protein n=1 Tax=Flavobacterium piscis TaxID=1114874 RepID=A0ABX2XK23_9FLAO|nr:hypothetical protein [Flavobacterium piscis]OCB75551.1 hypothetical protein FLP_08780 [Flavobacterium piscis]OXE95928.1 hypothetical protein B0A79_23860 [Flavobacterium piscis]